MLTFSCPFAYSRSTACRTASRACVKGGTDSPFGGFSPETCVPITQSKRLSVYSTLSSPSTVTLEYGSHTA